MERHAILIVVCLLLSIRCNEHHQIYEIDPTISDKIELNRGAEKDRFGHTNSYFMFSSQQMEMMFNNSSEKTSRALRMIDTSRVLIPNYCHCQMVNDSIKVAGGLFYGGGLGYKLIFTNKDFDGKIITAANHPKYRISSSNSYSEELHLKTKINYLKVQKYPSYKIGDTLKADVYLESDKFLQKDGSDEIDNQISIRILLNCILSQHEGF